jgi:hypothetical protein
MRGGNQTHILVRHEFWTKPGRPSSPHEDAKRCASPALYSVLLDVRRPNDTALDCWRLADLASFLSRPASSGRFAPQTRMREIEAAAQMPHPSKARREHPVRGNGLSPPVIRLDNPT